MSQISMFDEDFDIDKWPTCYEDIDTLFRKYILEGESDDDVFTENDIEHGKGKSYSFYGTKVFEFYPSKSEKQRNRLRVMSEHKTKGGNVVITPVTLDENTVNIRDVFEGLRNKKREIFSQLTVETFGCCNSFNECSDAGKCLHSNERFYNGCMYRQNLEAGRVFYGKNKNI